MVRHKRIYLDFFGYGEQDYIPSEWSGLQAEEIHHLVFKSQGGPDEIWNLIALTIEEHKKAQNNVAFNNQLKERHAEVLRIHGYAGWEKILQTLRT